MQIDILTLFPKMFFGPFAESIVKRAQEKKLVKIRLHDLRGWGQGAYKAVDDHPFGGGIGMVFRPEPIFSAVEAIKSQFGNQKTKVILLTPQGQVFNQKTAQKLAQVDHLIFICGHYEGIDERIRQHLVDEEISIGDYVLTGGELPAMIVIDTIIRLIPGVLAKEKATQEESFANNQLEYPQYTRPESFRGWKVPPILLSGNHEKISQWRQQKSLERTQKRRPDLLK